MRKYSPLFRHQRKVAQTFHWLFISALVGTISFKASPAYPWGSKGHEIIAGIAETQLTDTPRKRIKELLPQGTTLRAASTWPDTLIVLPHAVTFAHRVQIVGLAAKNQLPGMYSDRLYAEDGGLMSYGTDLVNLHQRATTYVDKILKGAKPADLPVEQPKKFILSINLKTAKQIGLTIPPHVLARADKVIR
jgi:hypothetical protein